MTNDSANKMHDKQPTVNDSTNETKKKQPASDSSIGKKEEHKTKNASVIEKKEKLVKQISEKIKKAQSVIIYDYRGLTVAEVTALRVEMRKAGIEYVVLRNSMVERACGEAKIDEAIKAMLKGPSAFAFGYDDAVAPAKILKDFIKKTKKCEIKGGIVEGAVADAEGVSALADLPPRETLIARLLGSIMSPVAGLAIVLDRVAKKLGEGYAEAPAEAAAAE